MPTVSSALRSINSVATHVARRPSWQRHHAWWILAVGRLDQSPVDATRRNQRDRSLVLRCGRQRLRLLPSAPRSSNPSMPCAMSESRRMKSWRGEALQHIDLRADPLVRWRHLDCCHQHVSIHKSDKRYRCIGQVVLVPAMAGICTIARLK